MILVVLEHQSYTVNIYKMNICPYFLIHVFFKADLKPHLHEVSFDYSNSELKNSTVITCYLKHFLIISLTKVILK